MIEQGINRIVELVKQGEGMELTERLDIDYQGTTHTYEFKIEPTAQGRRLGEILTPKRPAKVQVTTLTGFIDAVAAGVAGKTDGLLVHVEDQYTVALKSTHCDKFGVRDTLLTAKYTPPGAFEFDKYQRSEIFIIGLETCFLRLDGDDTDYVKAIAANLKAGDSVHAQDDGVNQTVTLKRGQIETTEVNLKPRVKLTPIRTFYETAPVEQEFLIRLKASEQSGLPQVALFSLGGTKWINESMLSIKKYLGGHLPAGTIIIA